MPARARVPSLAAALGLAATLAGQEPYAPAIPIRAASKEAEAAMARFELPKDLKVALWAAEPALANPVSFCLDHHGRLYVAETFRLHKGVTDNRNHQGWLDEELACRTVADRVAMYRRRFAATLRDWESEHERVRRLADTDGDGRADQDVVFADGFRELADGIGAGLLARDRDVWFACIPKLWRLTDPDGDGKAEARRALHEGYGVHTSLLGHDLHGLVLGIDGKLWFSIGDRGLHVEHEGKTLALPDEGAVLRCNLDGSELEIVHRGLRNPQELAFDDHGNCFTCDNNSDGGDQARWVYVVEGGTSGWQIGYQSIPDRGPWNDEKLWLPYHQGQPAWIVPPIANFTNGPSGIVCDPGTGLPERYRGAFLVCDFRGSSSISGIWAARVLPRGAGFELATTEPFLWKVLATDVDVGPDGAVYLTDWTEGWRQTGKGRVYRVARDGVADDPLVQETARLLREGFAQRSAEQLEKLLAHADRRVRLEAQLALAERPEGPATFGRVARQSTHRLARLHALWGLGILGRRDAARLAPALPLLGDLDEEVRAQAARVLGWAGRRGSQDTQAALRRALADRSARVRFFAATSLGQLGPLEGGNAALGGAPRGSEGTVADLVAVLRDNDDHDPYLRHAAVFGLAGATQPKPVLMADGPFFVKWALGTGRPNELMAHAHDPSPAVRLGILLALRRLGRREVAHFLDDPEPALMAEAARAIWDEPIDAALPQLAATLNRQGVTDRARLSRAFAANFKLGTTECVARIAAFVARPDAPEPRRLDALRALATWKRPSGRDLVLDQWRPIPLTRYRRTAVPRDHAELAAALTAVLPGVLRSAGDAVRLQASRTIQALDMGWMQGPLAELCRDTSAGGEARAAALEVLASLRTLADKDLRALADEAIAGPAALRHAGWRVLAELDPGAAVPRLEKTLAAKDADLADRQAALDALGRCQGEAAEAALVARLDELLQGSFPPPLALDLLEVATARAKGPALARALRYEAERQGAPPLQRFRECLEGGRKEPGSEVFWNDIQTTCIRCHTLDGEGGFAGPELRGIGTRLSREQILEALVDPSKTIAKGFGTCVVETKQGDIHQGMLKNDDGTSIVLERDDGSQLRLARAELETLSEPASAMPPVVGLLSKRQIRDLVEFLAGLVEKPRQAAAGKPETAR